ncbi:MAG: DUF2382 domain-containing protein [Candidatus Nitrosocosmicus sp.]
MEEDTTTIVKKPITETKTIEVPVIHEEISIKRRKPVGNILIQNKNQSHSQKR